MPGPLEGIRVVELAGIGPGPHAAMVLADLGADVVRVERPGADPDAPPDYVLRGRRTVALDLKSAEGRDAVLGLVEVADVLVEGFRPGVTERLGIGPEDCAARNPRLVYGRMTGWGQFGTRAPRAGHDINYISLTGALGSIGAAGGKPTLPLNLVGDYGGGSLFLVIGILAALVERQRSGSGQVVDAAIVDGASMLMQTFWGLLGTGEWSAERGTNPLDSGAPYYDTYRTSDGLWLAIGPLEPQFYTLMLEGLGLDAAALPDQFDRERWPELRERIAEAVATRTRDEWTARFDGTDACVTPVLSLDEARGDDHLASRGTLIEIDGVTQAAPAPRFSRTASGVPTAPARPGETDVRDVLSEWGAG
jgi:alpha-methylacyl-CoA racemase